MGAWLTPNLPTGRYICRQILVPDVLLYAVGGALQQLAETYNWEQYGTLSPKESANLASVMVESYLKSGCMMSIGMITGFAIATLPDGWLACDGATHQRVTYPELYASINPVFIIDADSFVVPDLRGRTIIGAGTGPGLTERVVGDAGGEESHILQPEELAAHTHSQLIPTLDFDLEGAGVPLPAAGQPLYNIPTGSTGGSQAHNNMQPYNTLTYAILAQLAGGGTSVSSVIPTAIVEEQKPNGVDANKASVGWNVRRLNTLVSSWPTVFVVVNPDYSFTLQPGVYDIEVIAVAKECDKTRLRLDVEGVPVRWGRSAFSNDADNTDGTPTLSVVVELPSESNLKIMHYVMVEDNRTFGHATGIGAPESYCTVKIRQLSENV